MKKLRYFLLVITLFNIVSVFAHPGSLDSNGGHYNRKTGEYHYHSGTSPPKANTYTTPYATPYVAPKVTPYATPQSVGSKAQASIVEQILDIVLTIFGVLYASWIALYVLLLGLRFIYNFFHGIISVIIEVANEVFTSIKLRNKKSVSTSNSTSDTHINNIDTQMVTDSDNTQIITLKSQDDIIVYISPKGRSYHSIDCKALKTKRIPIIQTKAMYYGYKACKLCHNSILQMSLITDKIDSDKIYDETWNLIYEGQILDGKYEGSGKLYYVNGNLFYVGSFKNGKMHGEGKCYDKSGVLHYEGYWLNGVPISVVHKEIFYD